MSQCVSGRLWPLQTLCGLWTLRTLDLYHYSSTPPAHPPPLHKKTTKKLDPSQSSYFSWSKKKKIHGQGLEAGSTSNPLFFGEEPADQPRQNNHEDQNNAGNGMKIMAAV